MLNPDKGQQQYSLNKNTLVTITSARSGASYRHKITLTHSMHTETPLRFQDKEEVVKLIEGIDLEEQQTEMDMEN